MRREPRRTKQARVDVDDKTVAEALDALARKCRDLPPKPHRPKRTASRFTKVTATRDGIQGLDRGVSFRASYSLFLIREAWERGADLEALADGFGPGAGTKGDWSAIRDSSPKAITAMLEAALNFLFGKENEAVGRVE